MDKKRSYLILSGLFLVAFLVTEFTDMYGDSQWFKFYALILCVTFLISGLAVKQKK